MSCRFVTGFGVLLLLGACTHTKDAAIRTTGSRPLSEVARSLGLTVRPTGFAEDRLLVHRDGRAFYVMAGKHYYRFMGDRKQLPGAEVIQVTRSDLLLPSELVAALRRDLDGSRSQSAESSTQPAQTADAKPPRLGGLTVVIDAGHGGTDPGAIYGGIHEKAVVLAVALATIRKLKALGVQAIPTRTSDTRPSLDARASLANRRKADLFISIHADSASRRSASGVGAFFRADGARGRQSRKLAVAVVDGIVTRTDASNRRARADSRGLRVLRKTHMPAILLEIGFLTNAAERRRLVDARYQERVAQGIVDGIKGYMSRTGTAALRRVGATPPR